MFDASFHRWGNSPILLALAGLAIAVSLSLPAYGGDLSEKSAPPAPPALSLTLKPHSEAGRVDYIDVTLFLEHPGATPRAPLLKMWLTVASIPTARYDGTALHARDARGELPLIATEEAAVPPGTMRDWTVDRPTEGDVTVQFRAVPRAVDASTHPGPLFDLRAEGAGIDGAGLTFLPLPASPSPYHILLQWDLSDLPAGSRGVSTLGEGYVDLVAPAQVLAECYYAAGPLSVFPPEANPNSAFNMYWLSAPPFDIDWVAQRIQTLFSFESRLFKDPGGSYRILIRKNPYAGGGGTALHRSFMFGWSEQIPTKRDDLQYLLAHEMTHTWPVLEGEHGETSWYSEGNAEYLSILSLWRAGLITADEFLRAINERARRYYTNPQQHLSNAEAEQHYWQDINASHVPYGRGWTYLVSVDAQIRRATRGKRELSDIVVTLTQDARDGRPHGVSRWIDLVTEEIGPRAKRDYEQMAYGHTIIPPADSFAPCFIRQRYRAPTFDLGFDQASLRGDRQTVQGLIPQSNAAIAGLQNGDHILKATTLEDAIGTQRMVIQVQRANGTVEVSYAPEGVSVGAIRWVRNRAVSDRACKY